MKRWNLLVLFVSLLLFMGSLRAVLDHWQYDDIAVDVAQMMLHQVTAADIEASVRQAIAEDNPADARMYLRLATRFGYAIDAAVFEEELQALESPLQTARRNATDFAGGFFRGNADSDAGIAGAVTADFTVVGDVRDLWRQYQLYSRDEPVNELIVVLSGIGVGLTAATVASAGAASPFKGGVSTAKLAARSQRLTPQFQAWLLRQGRQVFDHKAFLHTARSENTLDGIRRAATKAYRPAAARVIKNTAMRVNGIRKATSTSDAIRLLKYVENSDDLIRLEKLALKYGAETRGVMKLLGKGAIGTVRILRRSWGLIISTIALLLSFIAFLTALINTKRA